MEIDERIALVKRNSVEIIGENELRERMLQSKKISAYIGRAPTGALHLGHIVPLSKIFDFGKAGIRSKILIADLHAALDDLKAPWEQIDLRAKFTKKCLELALPWKTMPEFVFGSSYQKSKEYIMDIYKMSTMVTVKRATRAASEVTRMKNPKVSEMIYPIMQALDEEYLGVDMQWGGKDQRHIMALAREYLPKLGYKPRVELMFPLITSLKGPGVKMSSSRPETIIKVYDSEQTIASKLKKAYCPIGDVDSNPVIEIVKYLIFPIKGKLKIERSEKYGGDVEFNDYELFEKEYVNRNIHPLDLKKSVKRELVSMFAKVRNYFQNHLDMLEELGPTFMP